MHSLAVFWCEFVHNLLYAPNGSIYLSLQWCATVAFSAILLRRWCCENEIAVHNSSKTIVLTTNLLDRRAKSFFSVLFSFRWPLFLSLSHSNFFHSFPFNFIRSWHPISNSNWIYIYSAAVNKMHAFDTHIHTQCVLYIHFVAVATVFFILPLLTNHHQLSLRLLRCFAFFALLRLLLLLLRQTHFLLHFYSSSSSCVCVCLSFLNHCIWFNE